MDTMLAGGRLTEQAAKSTMATVPSHTSMATSGNSIQSLPVLRPRPNNTIPTRRVYTEVDLANWLQSDAFNYLEWSMARLSLAVRGKKVSDECIESNATKKLVIFLQLMTDWVDHIPLQTSPQRFGNKGFRDWTAKMEEHEPAFQESLLTPELSPVMSELSGQFRSCFGSGARLDYGTGHELSFLAYVTILRLIGVFDEEDETALVTRVFVAYLNLVRKLQKVFNLEPAGSKGVWGLDDHQHLSYLFGASQLLRVERPPVQPDAVLRPATIAPLASDYLYFSSIMHVHNLKTGPFAEHSPVLHNIATNVPNWNKVFVGLNRMYREEVLKKVPVVQHFMFGGILSWTRVGASKEEGLMDSSGDTLANADERLENSVQEQGTRVPWASLSIESPPPLTAVKLPTSSSSIPSRVTHSNPPRAFAAPELFPRSRIGDQQYAKTPSKRTVAESGSAAAASSPFGVLGSATAGAPSNSSRDRLPWSRNP